MTRNHPPTSTPAPPMTPGTLKNAAAPRNTTSIITPDHRRRSCSAASLGGPAGAIPPTDVLLVCMLFSSLPSVAYTTMAVGRGRKEPAACQQGERRKLYLRGSSTGGRQNTRVAIVLLGGLESIAICPFLAEVFPSCQNRLSSLDRSAATAAREASRSFVWLRDKQSPAGQPKNAAIGQLQRAIPGLNNAWLRRTAVSHRSPPP